MDLVSSPHFEMESTGRWLRSIQGECLAIHLGIPQLVCSQLKSDRSITFASFFASGNMIFKPAWL
jgi:hypothetical protein